MYSMEQNIIKKNNNIHNRQMIDPLFGTGSLLDRLVDHGLVRIDTCDGAKMIQ